MSFEVGEERQDVQQDENEIDATAKYLLEQRKENIHGTYGHDEWWFEIEAAGTDV